MPGQYLATDPKGRAVMIGAMEKSKLVYILNRVRNLRSLLPREDGTEIDDFLTPDRMPPPT